VLGRIGLHPAKAKRLSMTQQTAFTSSLPPCPNIPDLASLLKIFFGLQDERSPEEKYPMRLLDKPFPIRYKTTEGRNFFDPQPL
jgi:hypothetical protein